MSIDMLTHKAPAERQGGVFVYVSPSRLNCWLGCTLKFKFKYIDGIVTPTTPSLFVGKCCHRALETFYRHRMLGVTLEAGDVVRRLEASWDQTVEDQGMKFASAADEQTLRSQVAGLVRTYLAQLPADEPQPLAVEASMETPLVDPATGEDLGIPLLGIADLVLEDAAGPVIIDFKTSARSGPPFEITHEVQLSSYAYLYRRLTGRQESGLEVRSLIKTKTPKVAVQAYPARDETHFRRLFAVVREYLDALDKGTFNFRPGFGCSMCEFREKHCRAWRG